MSKRLILLDTHAILHRGYHALPDFATAAGEPTGALYGLSLMLLSIVEKLKPDYVVAAFDLPKPTHRHTAYKDYKAGRAKTDDALVSQIVKSRDLLSALSIPIYDKEGFEADDILGTVVELTKKDKDLEIIIASGDMDTLQLVQGQRVRVYTLKKGVKDTIMYDEDAVRERFGFGPELLPDYKGLRGDPSDNIVGIKGIGEKTATSMMLAYGSIEDIYKALKKDREAFIEKADVTPRIADLLENGQEDAEFSKVLATIRRDAPIDFRLPEKKWRDAIDTKVAEEMFKKLEFRTMGVKLRNVLGREQDLGGSGAAAARGSDEPEAEVAAAQTPVIDGSAEGARFKEALVMLWLLDSNKTDPDANDLMTYTGAKNFNEAYDFLVAALDKKGLTKVWDDIEKPLIPLLDKMKEDGVKIDVKYLEKLGAEYHKELAAIEKSIHRMAGVEFNIASPKQLGEILFVKLGLKSKKKTAGGALSTKESELEKLSEEHPIIDEILKYRELAKLLGTYIDTIPTFADEHSRIHPTSIQTGAATGRMATKDPAIQNIPNRTELGRRIRNAFVAEKGWKLLAFDYSQIELRIAAFLSKDDKFIDIFRRGEDVHAAVAAQVFGVPVESVTKSMRSQAKVINFGVMYGMGVTALQKNMGVDRKAAQKFYNDYFEKFHGLAGYLDAVKADAARKGYTETYFGRRRYFEGLKSKLPFIRAAAERMAINAPIQGTEADIVKIAMVRIQKYLEDKKLTGEARILMQIHDEIVIEAKDAVVKKIVPDIKEIMEGVIPPKDIHGITIAAEAKVGENWGEMEKL